MRRRLAFLIRDLGYGGAQRQLAALARLMNQGSDFEPHVVAFYDGPLRLEIESAGVPVHCIGKRHRWDLAGFLLRLTGTLRRIRPVIVHGYLAEANLMASLTRPFCGRPAVVWGIRDSQSDAHLWGVLGKLSFRLTTLLSSTPRGLIANSHAGRRWYRQQGYPMDDEDFRVIANGIDTGRFQTVADTQEVRLKLGLPTAQPVVGIIGRMNPMKDHDTFMNAAARVSEVMPETHFLIMGGGPDDYVSDLHQKARNLGIADRITWKEPRDDLENVYPALRVLVSSSSFGEGFSNVIAEAMACGIPCVATNVGDSAALIGGTGWTAEPGDADGLASGVLQILRLPGTERRALGAAARHRIENDFTLLRMAAQTTETLLDWLRKA